MRAGHKLMEFPEGTSLKAENTGLIICTSLSCLCSHSSEPVLTVARSRLQHEVQDEVPPSDVFLSDPFFRDSKYNLHILSIILKVYTDGSHRSSVATRFFTELF